MWTEATVPPASAEEINFKGNRINNYLDFIMFCFTHDKLSKFRINKDKQRRVRPPNMHWLKF